MAVLLFLSATVSNAEANSDVRWKPLKDRLVKDGFSRPYIIKLFASKNFTFHPEYMGRKMNVLLNTKLEARKPGKPKPPKLLKRYFNPILLMGAYAYMRENRHTLNRIHNQYQVPGEIIVALMLVETKLGKTIGKHKAFQTLASMALAGDFNHIKPFIKREKLSADTKKWLVKRTRQKGNWAYAELTALIRYSQPLGQDPTTLPASTYGAIGLCQFMPTTAEHYGADGSGDGRVDLFNKDDALYSIANFLKKHGWKANLSHDKQVRVIYRYNHSKSYAITILELAKRLRSTENFFNG